MSREKLQQTKRAAWFKGWDILIYALILLFLLALFLFFVIFPEREQLSGVEIFVKNERVFFCDFEEGSYTIEDVSRVRVEENGDLLLVTVTTEEGSNIVSVDTKARRADMTDADCSWSRDCVHMPPIENTASAPVSCIPHGVVVMPVGGDRDPDGTLQ